MYDRARGRTLLINNSGLWRFDGSDWTEIPTTPRHPVGNPVAAAWHEASQRVVYLEVSHDRTETHTLDGTEWTTETPTRAPSARLFGTLLPHPFDPVLVLVGSAHVFNELRDQWEWDGSDWTQRFPATPPPRYTAAFGSDPTGNHLLAFGGFYDQQVHADTWLYDAGIDQPTIEAGGLGCTGSAGVPSLTASGLPWLGEPFDLVLGSLPTSRLCVPFGLIGYGVNRNVTLRDIGMEGCQLHIHPVTDIMLTNAFGTATWRILLPGDPALNGSEWSMQAFVLDPKANPFGATTSNALFARSFGR